jgi:hypothetical protein
MIYESLQKLAKSVRYQNLFFACKEISGVRLFHNVANFSHLQQLFLSYLYNFESIHRDIVTEKISKHVLDNSIFWDAYLLWRQKEKPKQDNKEKTKIQDVKLVAGKSINFPKPRTE